MGDSFKPTTYNLSPLASDRKSFIHLSTLRLERSCRRQESGREKLSAFIRVHRREIGAHQRQERQGYAIRIKG